jgi:hypothetical protein
MNFKLFFKLPDRSRILSFFAGLIAFFVTPFSAFLVAPFLSLLLGLLVALRVPFGVAAIVGVGRSRGGGRWWCYLSWWRYLIGIGRWIITGSENVARWIIINKGPRKIKGSGKKERIQNYSGSQPTNECGRYKTCGKTGSDENDSVSKTRSDESDSTWKTGSDENSSIGKTGSHDNGSAGKTGPHDNSSASSSASRPGKSRARDSDQCDQGNYSDGFHNPSQQRNSGLPPAGTSSS